MVYIIITFKSTYKTKQNKTPLSHKPSTKHQTLKTINHKSLTINHKKQKQKQDQNYYNETPPKPLNRTPCNKKQNKKQN